MTSAKMARSTKIGTKKKKATNKKTTATIPTASGKGKESKLEKAKSKTKQRPKKWHCFDMKVTQ